MTLGEALSKRVARERLEALNKFIPVHERIKEKLQEQQQMKTDLFTGQQEMYKPITASMEAMLQGEADDIFQAPDKKPIAGLLKEISENVKQLNTPAVPAVPAVPAAEVGQAEGLTQEERIQVTIEKQRGRFTEEMLEMIDETKPEDLAEFAVESFTKRRNYLSEGNEKYANDIESWVDAIYRVKNRKHQISKMLDREYKKFSDGVDIAYNLRLTESDEAVKRVRKKLQEELKSRHQSMEKLPFSASLKQNISEESPYETSLEQETEPKKHGFGIRSHTSTYYDSQICPDSLVRDVSRLEVLMGGKDAGNNSIEIINEAAGIAQRLFQANIIDLHTYRELIDDLIEDKKYLGYHSD